MAQVFQGFLLKNRMGSAYLIGKKRGKKRRIIPLVPIPGSDSGRELIVNGVVVNGKLYIKSYVELIYRRKTFFS